MKKFSFFAVIALVGGFGFHAYAAITYSTTGMTNQDVTATISGLESGSVITNNAGASTYIFTGNGLFTFEYSGVTATGSEMATVSNIDKTAPIGTMTYSPNSTTSGAVTGTIAFNESGITISNNGGLTTYVFTGNTSFTFNFHDAVGNTGSTTATVTWITGAISSGTTTTGTTTGTATITTTVTATPEVETLTDVCADGDKSGSTTDGKCEAPSYSLNRTGSIKNSKYSQEMNNAYLYAYNMGLVNSNTIQKAYLDNQITRAELAKMLSIFAIKILGQIPNTGMACAFVDTSKYKAETRVHIKLVCQLGLMGLKSDGTPNTKFNPGNTVTRAQFGTILSRLKRGTTNNNTDPNLYYATHLQALKDAGIMTKIDTPNNKEKRGNVLLMLKRAGNQ